MNELVFVVDQQHLLSFSFDVINYDRAVTTANGLEVNKDIQLR